MREFIKKPAGVYQYLLVFLLFNGVAKKLTGNIYSRQTERLVMAALNSLRLFFHCHLAV